MRNMKAYGQIQSFHKGDRVTVKALVTNVNWVEGETYTLIFLGWFGPHPLFTRDSDGVTIPWVAFEAYHIELV